jgi:hypothetical protein
MKVENNKISYNQKIKTKGRSFRRVHYLFESNSKHGLSKSDHDDIIVHLCKLFSTICI